MVVDHGPNLTPAAHWEQFHPNVHSLQDVSNPGFAAGCNRGAEYALAHGAGWLWFLNNDATLIEPTLGRLLKLASDFPFVSLWGTQRQDGDRLIGSLTNKKWFERASKMRRRKHNGRTSEADAFHAMDKMEKGGDFELLAPNQSLSGASIFLSKGAWEKLGAWPEKYFLFWEDAAWCLRAHKLGMYMAMTSLKIAHTGSAATKRHSPLTTFYGARNQLLLHLEALPDARLTRLFLKCYILQKCILRWRLHILAPTWRGILAASRQKSGRDSRY
jgi:GT2 family glycosyltransferase